MSEHAPLDQARQELLRRGYLKAGPASSGLAGLGLFLTASGAISLLLALVAAASGSQNPAFWGVLFVGFFPSTLAGVGVGWVVLLFLAKKLVDWGGRPGDVAAAMGVLAGGSVAGLGVSLALPPMGSLKFWLLAGALAGAAVAFGLSVREKVAGSLLWLSTRSAGRWLQVAAVCTALGGVAFLVPLTPSPPSEGALAFSPPRARLAVVAVDGLAREDLEAAGQLLASPPLAEMGSWAWAPLPAARKETPAPFWTTVACGVPSREHGVQVQEETRLFGMASGLPLTPTGRGLLWFPFQLAGAVTTVARPVLERRFPTFWEMAARAGYPTAVVGWWGSWPVRQVPALVVSERALFGGVLTPDAVSAKAVPWLEGIFTQTSSPILRVEGVLQAMVERALQEKGAFLLALAFPSWDMRLRSAPFGALARPAAALAALPQLGEVMGKLREGKFQVLVVGAAWHGGTWFVAYSGSSGGPLPGVRWEELAPTVLDLLGLPRAPLHPRPRRDLTGVQSSPQGEAAFGPPPPVADVPPKEAAQLQREVLRSLGYLQ